MYNLDVDKIQKLKRQNNLEKLAQLSDEWNRLLDISPELSNDELFPKIAFCHALASEIVKNSENSKKELKFISFRAKFYLAEIKLVVYSLTSVEEEADKAKGLLKNLLERKSKIVIDSRILEIRRHLNFFERYQREIFQLFGDERDDELRKMLTPDSLEDFMKYFPT